MVTAQTLAVKALRADRRRLVEIEPRTKRLEEALLHLALRRHEQTGGCDGCLVLRGELDRPLS